MWLLYFWSTILSLDVDVDIDYHYDYFPNHEQHTKYLFEALNIQEKKSFSCQPDVSTFTIYPFSGRKSF